MATQKVVHLHLHAGVEGHNDFYFGSIKAIYSRFDAHTLGIRYKSLVDALRHSARRGHYHNSLCEIHIGTLIPNTRRNKA